MKLLRAQSVVPRAGDRQGAPRTGDDAAATGASRTLRLALLAAACSIVLAAAALGARRWLITTPGFAVRRVAIEGAVHADVASLSRATSAMGINTFQVDLDAVRDRLLGDPWIADARVRRVLPHELRVKVVERVPVGLQESGGACAVVDGAGHVLESGPAPGRFPLPSIIGLERIAAQSRAARVAHAAASLAAIRASSPGVFRKVRAIDASGGDRFTLVTDDLPPIWITGPESADEVAAYGSRIETIRGKFGAVAYVDARWNNRLFIMRKT
jgi:hypothetical protein